MEKIDAYELFDALVEKFLCNEMTEKEEEAFKAELQSDPAKMERARIAALMIQQIQEVGLARDQKIVEGIKEMNPHAFKEAIPIKKEMPIELPITVEEEKLNAQSPQEYLKSQLA